PSRRKWKSKGGSQEAHEAIRPSDCTVEVAGSTEEEQALYDLIRKRTLAVVLPDAVYAVRSVSLISMGEIEGKTPLFLAKGSTLIKEGWRSVYSADEESDEEREDDAGNPIPALTVGDELDVESGSVLTKKTKAPSRYTEATLVRDMEKRGIGRPSTYAAIMDNISRRGYISSDKNRRLSATELGESLIDALLGNFEFVVLDFTAELENDLDKVATGQRSYQDVVGSSANTLSSELGELSKKIKPEYPCDACGNAMRRLNGKNGFFWGCSNYPDCKETRPDDNGKPSEAAPVSKPSDKYKCPACDKPLVHRVKEGKYNFWGCAGFPKCKKSFNSNDEDEPIIK